MIASPVASTVTSREKVFDRLHRWTTPVSRKQMTFRAHFNGVKRRQFSCISPLPRRNVSHGCCVEMASNKICHQRHRPVKQSGLVRQPIPKLNFNPEIKVEVARMASLVNVSKFAIKPNQTSTVSWIVKVSQEPPKEVSGFTADPTRGKWTTYPQRPSETSFQTILILLLWLLFEFESIFIQFYESPLSIHRRVLSLLVTWNRTPLVSSLICVRALRGPEKREDNKSVPMAFETSTFSKIIVKLNRSIIRLIIRVRLSFVSDKLCSVNSTNLNSQRFNKVYI